jgi:hypothetical protein
MTRQTAGLLVGLTVAVSVAVTFAFLYFTRLSKAELGVVRVETGEDPLAPNKPSTIRVFVGEGPFLQKDTVSPRSQYTGTVYYPIPFATPPNLKLTCRAREYVIAKQNEVGFRWEARPVPGDFRGGKPANEEQLDAPIEKLVGSALRPNIQYDDFTWEARGVPASANTLRFQLYEQNGTFQTAPGQEADVIFPIPYAGPPNIEIDGPKYQGRMSVFVVEVKPTGFRWKNAGTRDSLDSGPAQWKARGIPAIDPPLAPKK